MYCHGNAKHDQWKKDDVTFSFCPRRTEWVFNTKLAFYCYYQYFTVNFAISILLNILQAAKPYAQ